MKTLLLKAFALSAVLLLLMPALTFAQPTLGTAKDFVLFSTNKAVTNQNVLAKLTGNVGTNGAASTGFGNVDGVMHDNDGASAAASTDLLTANGQITASGPNIAHAVGLGGGETLPPGVYFMGAGQAATLSGVLILSGTASDIFIFKIDGSFSISGTADVQLTGGVTACNVFWQANGVIDMAVGAKMKGTVIANNAAINMTGCTLEGRALSISGAITVDGITARIPIGCGSPNPSPNLTGPAAPTLVSTQCYVLFSSSGNVTNTVPAAVFTGDIGTNLGITSGFVNVTGTVHPGPDVATGSYSSDLGNTYTYLHTLVKDIELLYPQQLGNDLVLTPHTYLMSAAALLTGKLYLNAQGNADAVFVIQVSGALTTSSGAEIVPQNNAQLKNVYWKVTGAVGIGNNSIFKGTIVSNSAIDMGTGVALDGRALTITGVITTAANTASIPGCVLTSLPSNPEGNTNEVVILYPNPFTTYTTIMLNGASQVNSYELRIYNVLGKEVMNTRITQEVTTLETSNLPTGIYFYKMIGKNRSIKSGKLVSQQ